GTRYAIGSGSSGWRKFSSQNYGGNYSGRSYNAGRYGYARSNYQGGSRQMEAYRGLTQSGSPGGFYNGYGSGYRGGGAYNSYGSGYRGGSFYNSQPRYSARGFGSPRSFAGAAS